MKFLKENLDKLGLLILAAYVCFLTFVALDDHLGWEILVDMF